MNRFLSIIYLYNKATWQKIILVMALIPLGFSAASLWGGDIAAVLIFIGVLILGLLTVATTLNGKKDLKATNATIGFTMRRMHTSPTGAYFAVFLYYLGIIVIIWAAAVLTFLLLARFGLSSVGADDIKVGIALELLRTQIGHALLPVAHPQVLLFNLIACIALAGECARSCYLSWHNGSPSAGAALIAVALFYVWACNPDNTFILLATLVVVLYGGLSIGDVIFREKRPKGDPFKVNKYAGVMDMNSTDFDEELYLEVNSPVEVFDPEGEAGYLSKYGRGNASRLQKWNPFWLRRRFMPLGSNLEKANTFFGSCIFIGFAEHLLFFGKYQMQLKEIEAGMKGATIDSGLKMPYFWDLMDHTYYGYLLAAVLVLAMQIYWNWAYYNKETKSVYVMKRLPNRKEYPRTIWISPVIEALLILLFMAAHTLVDIGLYMTTPDLALHADYLSKMLPF